jgi:hypothetical protein
MDRLETVVGEERVARHLPFDAIRPLRCGAVIAPRMGKHFRAQRRTVRGHADVQQSAAAVELVDAGARRTAHRARREHRTARQP